MALETKDYVTFTFSTIALGLSVYNLVRAWLDARVQNRRTFEQKRFEAAATAAEVQGHYVQSSGALDTLRFEAQRSKDSALVKDADNYIDSIKKSLGTFAVIERELVKLPAASGDPNELLVIEKLLGQIRTQKAAVAVDEMRFSNFIETARRKILASSLVP